MRQVRPEVDLEARALDDVLGDAEAAARGCDLRLDGGDAARHVGQRGYGVRPRRGAHVVEGGGLVGRYVGELLQGQDLNGLVPSSPERVETVRKIFKWCVENNLGQFAIAQRLNEARARGKGPVSPTGKHWTAGTVQSILQNEHYVGSTVFNKRSMGKFFKLTGEGDELRPERLPKHLPTAVRHNARADWLVIEGTHEPLVPKDIFAAALAKRRVRRQDGSQSRRSLGSKYLFSGKLTCGECGFHFQGITKKNRNGLREGYVCGGYKLRGRHTCENWFLPSDIIEPAVFQALERELGTFNLSGVIGRAGEELGDAPAMVERKREELAGELRRTEGRLEELLDCITPENKDLVTEKMVALRKERDRLRAELGEIASIEVRALASTKLVGRLVKLASEFKELWAVATLAEKKEFVSLMVTSISIHPKRKTAAIRLSPNYLELKQLAAPDSAQTSLIGSRGDPRPSDRQSIVAYLDVSMPSWKAA